MINIREKQDCCGCHACASICPKQCIVMQDDEQGFFYPKVELNTCIDCGLCEKICPVINQSEPRKPLKVYAAKNKNEEIRLKSSSGGIFTPLAENTINEGGVVFGAKFDENWNVIHAWTDTIEGIADFRGSKYVQSTIGDTYREAREFLKQGRKVLFSGTPCQIAGLKRYLRKEYDNLLTVDVVCHGVPSPLVWRRYLKEIKNELNASSISRISFRNKSTGWKTYNLELKYHQVNSELGSSINVETEFVQLASENIFMKGFLANLYLRPSCYACAARSGKSGSDISIADFWGIQNYYPDFDDDKGVGLILLNTYKGIGAYEILDTENLKTTYELGVKYNACIEHSVESTKYVQKFWGAFGEFGMDCIDHIIVSMRPTKLDILIGQLKNKIRRTILLIDK